MASSPESVWKSVRRSALKHRIAAAMHTRIASSRGDDAVDVYADLVFAVETAAAIAQDFADRNLIRPNGRWQWTSTKDPER